MTLEATVSRHQAFYRFRHQLPEPLTSTITEGVTREQLDEGLLNALRYFINYTFYKFGLEVMLERCSWVFSLGGQPSTEGGQRGPWTHPGAH